jgi:hypothetical protein
MHATFSLDAVGSGEVEVDSMDTITMVKAQGHTATSMKKARNLHVQSGLLLSMYHHFKLFPPEVCPRQVWGQPMQVIAYHNIHV